MNATRVRFELPDALVAAEPPEARGLARDEVRLLAAGPDGVQHLRFTDLGRLLHPGDLLVVNTSATWPAAVAGRRAGDRPALVHFSTEFDDGSWAVELRRPGRPGGPARDGTAGESVELPGGLSARLVTPWPDPQASTSRLWRTAPAAPGAVRRLLTRHGAPIRYGYVPGAWPIACYQTVFARDPGSAEMPSAGRPFTPELVTELVAAGVTFAPITLHTGVSSLEEGEEPLPERFRVPAATARLVESTRRGGGRVIAVGTTVTRALETVGRLDGTVSEGAGWTTTVLGGCRPAHVVDGLVTGWHAPGASHLDLLEAVAGPGLVEVVYREALAAGYLWHEFGDSCLLLAERPGS